MIKAIKQNTDIYNHMCARKENMMHLFNKLNFLKRETIEKLALCCTDQL